MDPIDIDHYNSHFPEEVRQLLAKVRAAIMQAAPEAKEVISYKMPAFKQNGILVWYAAFTKHIGFYPKSSAIGAFKEELSTYKGGKGSVQFPYDKPMPLDLISRIVKFRIAENQQKVKVKKNKQPSPRKTTQ
ncbi:MAG: iron chaperone [Bacteroidales bacterium]